MKKRGFTLIELLIVVAIIAILAAIAVPNFLEAQIRSKVSRVKADQRSLATALESYYVDNNLYPAYTTTFEDSCNGGFGNASAGLQSDDVYAFRVWSDSGEVLIFHTLTSPIAYITSYFEDPFADTRGAIFQYYNDDQGWIVWSFGPDTDETEDEGSDLGRDGAVESIYRSTVAQPSYTLLTGGSVTGTGESCTYDPTNGTISAGDVWRVKQ